MTIVYYAHPIDQATGETNPVLDICQRAMHEAVVVFDPATAWTVDGCLPHPDVQKTNMRVMHCCDVVLVAAPSGVPTIGVWLEAHEAAGANQRVVIVTDITDSWPLSWLEAKQNCTVIDLTQAYNEPDAIQMVRQELLK